MLPGRVHGHRPQHGTAATATAAAAPAAATDHPFVGGRARKERGRDILGLFRVASGRENNNYDNLAATTTDELVFVGIGVSPAEGTRNDCVQ